MPEKTTELIRLESQRDELLQSDMPSITNETELTQSVEFLSKLRIFMKNAESVRQFIVKPLNDHIRTINVEFKKLLAPIMDTEQQISQGVQSYRQLLLKQAQEEQVRLQQKAEEELVNGDSLIPEAVASIAKAPEKRIETSIGNVGFTVNWTFEVVDASLIPREYLMVDMIKIGKVVKALKQDTKILGVKVIRREIPVVRSS